MWKYDVAANTWTWIRGNTDPAQDLAGIYGTMGVPDIVNQPGSRTISGCWTDVNGNLWMFGGQGQASTLGTSLGLSDPWKYNVNNNTWTWVNYIVNRYYSHDKSIRIKYNLRHDSYDYNVEFNVQYILMAAAKVMRKAMEHQYPIDTETYQKEKFGDHMVANFYQAVNWLNLNLIEAEERLLDAEVKMQKNQEFNPSLYNPDIEQNAQFALLEAVARGSLRG